MSSGQVVDWTYSTAPRAHMGRNLNIDFTQ